MFKEKVSLRKECKIDSVSKSSMLYSNIDACFEMSSVQQSKVVFFRKCKEKVSLRKECKIDSVSRSSMLYSNIDACYEMSSVQQSKVVFTVVFLHRAMILCRNLKVKAGL